MDHNALKKLVEQRDAAFWGQLALRSREIREFEEFLPLSTLRKKARARGVPRPGQEYKPLRVALLGGCTLYPLSELLEHFLEIQNINCQLFTGDFDNYVSEIMDPAGKLYEFSPQVVVLLPPEQRCKYQGKLTDSREMQHAAAVAFARQLLDLSQLLHERTQAEVVLGNVMLPAHHDLGPFRSRTLGSDWSFRKTVNTELGLNAPSFVHLCDIEFLTYRCGALRAMDERGWFESKQPGSPALLLEIGREAAHIIGSLHHPPKKVLVLDLDNTLWGGVVAEEGLEGIEIGDTSPRGEAFKAFQKYILSLQERGVLLAVCSKNDMDKALEPFEKHPEMVIRRQHIVSFKANWEPKSDNLRQMAAELNLGLDSFVFVDDNPAEIDVVRQFAPEVSTLLLGPDPSTYVGQLKDCRWFEPRSLTAEDAQRTEQYQSDAQRQALLESVTDMDAYLQSLEMEAVISEFTPVDVPRLAQLINKSNQFNLTTRRRTEAEVGTLMKDSGHVCFSVRLKDRFGDHGLISIVIGRVQGQIMEIDTWLMSCRVLKRQVEEEVVNEFMRLAQVKGCAKVVGVYRSTPKNQMVLDLYPRMGFKLTAEQPDHREFERDVRDYRPTPTKIKITRRAYAPG